MSTVGHNGGPSLMPGRGWQTHCWRKARADLLPHLPIEVVRARVKRAAQLGLDYKTYAGVRATTGRDLVAFLFSSNALRLFAPTPSLPQDRAAALSGLIDCERIALVQAPVTVDQVRMAAPMSDTVCPAPCAFSADGVVRDRLRAALGSLPSDAVLLIGDTAWERDWSRSGRLAGYLSADRFFVQDGGASKSF